jgi:predicted ATPase
VVFDRSPICTLALSTFLDRAPTLALTQALERIERERIYERRVLFIENLGHCEPTAVRRISFEDSLRFEAVHRDVYARLGYDCVSIPAADVASRLQQAVAVIDG